MTFTFKFVTKSKFYLNLMKNIIIQTKFYFYLYMSPSNTMHILMIFKCEI